MKADKSAMFPVELNRLKADEGAPFPIFLFLQRNHRFVPIRLPGDPIGSSKFALFKSKHSQLFVPNKFQDAFNNYLQFVDRGAAPAAAPPPPTATPAAPKSEEAVLVKDALADPDLSTEEKAEVLAAVSQDILRAVNQITTRGEAARSEGLRQCKEIADEILRVAAQDSNIYDEILALRTSQEDIEHSVMTGTMAAMFGMAIGLGDEKILADLTVAAIFHDIGLVKVNPAVVGKPETKWSTEERKEYEKHVEASVEVLRESGSDFHPRIFRMILEHHENYDGSGFPKGLRGAAIDETSAILHLANLFDRLCSGKQTGTELSPAEAFDYIQEITGQPGAVQEVQPEVVQRVFQFMLTEKTAAVQLQAEAEERTRRAMKEKTA